MASVNSPLRRLVKPVLHKIFGDRIYELFHFYGKLRDIKLRLVEEDEMALLPKLIGPKDQVIDIGANFAYYTVRLAELCREGEVHAFEPIPGTFRTCRRIVKHFGLKNVRLHEAGVGAETATLSFQVPLQEIGTPSAGQAHLSGRNNQLAGHESYHPFARHQEVRCQVMALDDPAWAARFQRLSFVKIDIEGAEIFALRGMQKLLSRFQPVILLEVCPFFLQGFGVSEDDLTQTARGMGYDFYRYQPASGKLFPHARSSFTDGNYFLIHSERKQALSHLIEGEVN